MPEERTVYKVHLPAYHISCQVDYMCVKIYSSFSFHSASLNPVSTKPQLLVLTHGRQFIFQRHFLVDISAGIKETL